MFKATQLIAATLLICAASGFAEDDDDDAKRAIKLSGTVGLTGFQDMVDARTPSTLSVRGGARYHFNVQNNDFRGAINATRKAQRHQLSLYAGGSLLGLIDVAARVPYLADRVEIDRNGLPDLGTDTESGFGNVDLAAKVTLELGPIDLAIYAEGKIPSGEPKVRDLGSLEYGAAATFSIFNSRLSVHGNLAGLNVEEGLAAIRFRVGAAFVLFDFEAVLVRLYAYGDGIEYEGRADSDVDLDFGAQAILFGFLTVELGTSIRLLDANYIDDSTKRALRERGIFDRHFEDDGTWAIEFGVGIVF